MRPRCQDNLLSRLLLVVVCSAAVIGSTQADAEDLQLRYQGLFEDLEQIKSAFSQTALWEHEAHVAVRAEGVRILPALAERYRNADFDSGFSVRDYGQLFVYIAGFRPYLYSTEHHLFGEIDLFESDTTNLPAVAINLRGQPEISREKWLAWWEQVQHDEGALIRLEQMREAIGQLDPSAEDLDSTAWRAYERIAINYGVFNLSAFIRLVEENNNPVAFAELLRVIMHPASLNVSEYALDPMGRIRAVAANFPEHEERIEVIREWWAAHKSEYDALPQLRDAIQASFDAARE